MNNKIDNSISVIIPLLGSTEHTTKLILSLREQSIQPDEIIFIISKCGNWQKTIELIEKEQVLNLTFFLVPKLFPGAARNYGAKRARSNWIAFLDIQTIPAEKWLESMLHLTEHESKSVNLVVAAMQCSAVNYFQRLLKAATFGNKLVSCLPGSIVRRHVFIASGGFLENVRAGEDWEWLNRFKFDEARKNATKAVVSYEGLPIRLGLLASKWFKYSFENSKVDILLKEKFSYMGLAFLIFAVLLYRWNHLVSGEQWNEQALLFIPNINKIFWSTFLSSYLVFRGIYKPLLNKENTYFLFPFSWLLIGFLGLFIDSIKAPGRIYGSLKYTVLKISSHFH